MGRPRKVKTPEEQREYDERRREQNRLAQQRRRQNPAALAQDVERTREARQDPEFLAREADRKRQRRQAAPEIREAENAAKRRKYYENKVKHFNGANAKFTSHFLGVEFGCCDVCGRLWYQDDLMCISNVTNAQKKQSALDVLTRSFPQEDVVSFKVCGACRDSLLEGQVPLLSKTRGYVYPPAHLPPLNIVEERLADGRGHVAMGDGATMLGVTSCPPRATMDTWFRCCFCPYIIADQPGIISHLVAHSDEQLTYQQYPTSFGTLSYLQGHIPRHTGEVVQLGKTSCPSRAAKDSRFRCRFCPYVTTDERGIIGHLVVHGVEQLKSQIQRYATSFGFMSEVHDHIQGYTGGEPFERPSSPPLLFLAEKFWSTGVSKPPKTYKRKQCSRPPKDRDCPTTHTQTPARKKPYKCKQCAKSFAHNSSLIFHLNTHTCEKPYKCTQCPKVFAQRGNLIRHVRTHTDERPFKCPQCPKTRNRPSELADHIRMHTGEKPFKCEMCPKSFAHLRSLTSHVRKHTDEKRYKCEHCPKCFFYKHSLISHTRTHTGEKPYMCELCPESFAQKGSLIFHRLRHTGEKPFRCERCTMSFARKSYLLHHITTHTGEKPYRCEYCTKAFAQLTTLTTHARLHTGEKPYKCKYCPRAFPQKSNLVYHYKTHAKKGT